jgi:hypothetical protein
MSGDCYRDTHLSTTAGPLPPLLCLNSFNVRDSYDSCTVRGHVRRKDTRSLGDRQMHSWLVLAAQGRSPVDETFMSAGDVTDRYRGKPGRGRLPTSGDQVHCAYCGRGRVLRVA